MAAKTIDTDVLIVGSGMAGLVAAVKATEHDADVLVLEKGPRAGGSMYLSYGLMYTYESLEEVRRKIPNGTPELQRLVIESYEDGVAWLRDQGVELERPKNTPFGRGWKFDPAELTARFQGILDERGGQLLLETPMRELTTDEGGRVTGAVASTPDDGTLRIRADSTILATGGFQGNEKLVAEFITKHTENLWLRSNPWSTGDGMLAAEEVGAKVVGGLDTFYGHALPAPPAEIPASDFVLATQYHGSEGIALDQSGSRFTDESESAFEHTLAQDIAVRADGLAYYVLDDDLYHSDNVTGRNLGEMVENARNFGGRVAEVRTLGELGDVLTDWDADGEQAVRTIQEYNEKLDRAAAEEIYPPRHAHHNPITSPPFYVVEVQPGITFTMGGLAINDDAQVCRRTGTSSTIRHYPIDGDELITEPIAGLYAAGVDIGNINRRHYLGGLCVAMSTGLVAGVRAATDAAD